MGGCFPVNKDLIADCLLEGRTAKAPNNPHMTSQPFTANSPSFRIKQKKCGPVTVSGKDDTLRVFLRLPCGGGKSGFADPGGSGSRGSGRRARGTVGSKKAFCNTSIFPSNFLHS